MQGFQKLIWQNQDYMRKRCKGGASKVQRHLNEEGRKGGVKYYTFRTPLAQGGVATFHNSFEPP